MFPNPKVKERSEKIVESCVIANQKEETDCDFRLYQRIISDTFCSDLFVTRYKILKPLAHLLKKSEAKI